MSIVKYDYSNYDLAPIFANKDIASYNNFITLLTGIAKEKYLRKEIFSVRLNNTVIQMSVGRFLANAILLASYCEFGIVPAPERFTDIHFDSTSLHDHIDVTIKEILNIDQSLLKPLNKSIAYTITNLSDIACEINKLSGITINLYNLFEMIDSNNEILKYLYWKMPTGLPFDELEKTIDEAGKNLAKHIMETSDGAYARLLRSNSAITIDQFRQIFVTIGTKPSLEDGRVIDTPIESSFLHGMKNARDFFICSIGARKALITNLKKVKDSGYLARKLILLVISQLFDKNIKYCGTKHGVYTYIFNEDHIKRLKGRYVLDNNLQPCKIEEPHLRWYMENKIPIMLLSPITCASNDICCTCGGDIYTLNSDIHYSELGAINISEQLTQGFLKNKHFLTTTSKSITWPDILQEFCIIERSYIISNVEMKSIIVKIEDIDEGEDDNESEELEADDAPLIINKLTIIDSNNKYHYIDLPIYVQLKDETWVDAETTDEEIILHNPKPESTLFKFDIENVDLSASLNDLVNKIEKHAHVDINTAYYDIMTAFIESKINIQSVSIESIIRAMVRDKNNIMRRPDFSSYTYPEVQILKLKSAIFNSPSVSNSIAFQGVINLLTSHGILEKDVRGVLDIFFS